MKSLTFFLLVLLYGKFFYSMRIDKKDTLDKLQNDLKSDGILDIIHSTNGELENINSNYKREIFSNKTKEAESNFSIAYEISSVLNTIFLEMICDKSFLITIVMAYKYSKLIVLISAIFTFCIFGLFSEQIRQNLNEYISPYSIEMIEILLFLFIGMKMLIDGLKISNKMNSDKMRALHNEINKAIFKENEILAQINDQENIEEQKKTEFLLILNEFFLTFMILFLFELGNKYQLSNIYSNYKISPLLNFFSLLFAKFLLTIIALLASLYLKKITTEKTFKICFGITLVSFGVIFLYIVYIEDYVIMNKTWYNTMHTYQVNSHFQKMPDREVLKNSFLK